MPVTPVVPVTTPNPTLPVGAFYGSPYMVPTASGITGDGYFKGPWVITTQTLNIEYARMPRGNVSWQNLSCNLSAANVDYNHSHTTMFTIIDAQYSMTSSTEAFPISGEYLQAQTFEFYAVSTDFEGSSYGELDGSTLGPRGTIATRLPFYHRRPMTAAELTAGSTEETHLQNHLVASACHGANFQYGSSSLWLESDGTFNIWFGNKVAEDLFTAWGGPYPRTFVDSGTPGAMVGVGDRQGLQQTATGIEYNIWGGYSTAQEDLALIFEMIQDVGYFTRGCGLERSPSTRLIGQGYWPNTNDAPTEDFTGIPEYSEWRHDYYN